jgi:hypothetical protein
MTADSESRRRAILDRQEARLSPHWVIVKTKKGKELRVCSQIEALAFQLGYTRTFEVWCPMEVRFHRIQWSKIKVRFHRIQSAKIKALRIWESPLLSTIAFAAIPEAVHGVLQSLECFDSLHRPQPYAAPSIVSQEQIAAFKDMVDRENTIRRRQFTRKQEGKKGKRTVKLDGEGLATLMKELFGLEVPEMEEAA